MADQKLTQLTERTTPAVTDLLYIVADPAGSPVERKITLDNLLKIVEGALGFVVGDGVNVITTGVQGFYLIPYDCTITRVTVLSTDPAVTSGSIVLDLWVDTYANYPPTDADSITASAPPTITTAVKSQDASLTGWTKNLPKGSILAVNVDSVTSFKRVLLVAEVTH